MRLDFWTFKSLLRLPEYRIIRKTKRGRDIVSVYWHGKQIFVKPLKDLSYKDYWHIRRWTWKWRNHRWYDIELEADREEEKHIKHKNEIIADFSKEAAKDLINTVTERRTFS